MRPSLPTTLPHFLGATIDEDRHRDEARRHLHDRALLETRAPERASRAARLGAGTVRAIRRDRHSLTSYPCRLPDGKIGRTAVIPSGDEWSLVCRVG